MAMTPGSVSVADDATVTKDGCAEAVFDAMVLGYEAALSDADASPPTDPAELAAVYRGMAAGASAIGPAIIQYILDNAEADGTGPVT